MKKKTVALLLALTLVLGVVAGGTIAWLTSTSDTVTNTFTTSDITVKLEETKGTGTTATEKSFKMTPGWTIEKDPKATVVSGSEKCYLFVKLEKSTNFDSFLTYAMADGWQKLEGEGVTDTVYYLKVDDTTYKIGTAYSVLKNDQVTVLGSVTKEMMQKLDNGTETKPTLTVTAYASQLMKNNTQEFTALEAWKNISNPSGTTTP